MKWFGVIGFNDVVEEEPGIWVPKIVKKEFFGDVLRSSWREQQGAKINEDLAITNTISIVADPYLLNNFHKIAYIVFSGAKWTVSSVEVNTPRLTLSLGSLYLEDEEEEESDDD